MSTENLAATLRALHRYERVQARLLADEKLACIHREEEIAQIRRWIARDAEPTRSESPVRIVVKRMNPLEPCSFADAHIRFTVALTLLPVSIMLADGIATVLEKVMS